MKSVVMLWLACLEEAGQLHSVRINRDRSYALSRIEDEGVAFLAITLPSYEKDLLQALDRGYIGSDLFCGFRHRGGLPAFLSGFLRRVFDDRGFILSDASPSVIRSLRQVLLLVSKIEVDCSPTRVNAALESYRSTDEMVPVLSPELLGAFGRQSRKLYASFFSDVEARILNGDWVPRHSGGAVATGESYNARWSLNTWTERLQEFIPYWSDLVFSPRQLQDCTVDVLPRDSEAPAKVLTVPKTLKSPRIIAEEPSYLQFVQQGVLHVMNEVLAQPCHSMIRMTVGWDTQEPNRVLARDGSVDGSFATIDLSDASDRVSLELVKTMLADHPFLLGVVLAGRSEVSLLPSGERVVLRKFASMGSSLCFPFEAMVFHTLVALGIAEHAGRSTVSRAACFPAVRIFGDDIIVPREVVQPVVSYLEAYGLRVNQRKSFWTGLFRESCGSDWFSGHNVSVFKLRAPLPSSRRHVGLLRRAIAFHNHCFDSGWFSVAEHVRNVVKPLFYVPFVSVGSTAVGFWTFDDALIKRRFSPKLHRFEVRSLHFVEAKPSDPLGDSGALYKCLAVPSYFPRDSSHLVRDGRSQLVGVTVGWSPET